MKKRKMDDNKSNDYPSSSFLAHQDLNNCYSTNPFQELFEQTDTANGEELYFVSKSDKEPNIDTNELEIIENEEENNLETLELEKWLAFKGTFDEMQALARLRFKFMSYFLALLKNPNREMTLEDEVIFIFF